VGKTGRDHLNKQQRGKRGSHWFKKVEYAGRKETGLSELRDTGKE